MTVGELKKAIIEFDDNGKVYFSYKDDTESYPKDEFIEITEIMFGVDILNKNGEKYNTIILS